MSKIILSLSSVIIVCMAALTACQPTDTPATPTTTIEQADEASLLEQQAPVSEEDDLDSIRTELDQTIIVEEDFSDL